MENARDIFSRYQEISPRLPKARVSGAVAGIGSLLDLEGQIDAFVFDAFGVLNVGDTLIPGADARLRDLRQAGHRIRVLTNAASYDKFGAIAKFRRLGLALEDSEIITSRDAALRDLDARRWGAIAAPDDPLADLPVGVTRLGDAPGAYDAVEGFVFLSSADWSERRQLLLENALARRVRPLIIANADLVAPRADGFSLEPGYFGHRLADRTGVPVRFYGKPFGDVFAMASDTLTGIAPERIAMCGDTLHTDILGAAAVGWRTVLVTRDGLFAGLDASEFVAASGIRPDWQTGRI